MIDIEELIAQITASHAEQAAAFVVGNAPPELHAAARATEVQIAFARWFVAEINAGNTATIFEACGLIMGQMAMGGVSLLNPDASPGSMRTAMTIMMRAFGISASPVMLSQTPPEPEGKQTLQ